MQKFNLYILIITFLFSFTTISFSHEGATGIVKERMEKFKASKSIMRQINKSFDNKDFSIIKKGASKLKKWGLEMENYFPEGSDIKPSEANERIWLEPESFKIAIDKFTQSSIELLKVADEQDLDKTIAAFRKLASTCKGCHKQFRN